MKNSQKILSVMSLLVAPLVASLLVTGLPKFGILLFTILGVTGALSSGFAQVLVIVLLIGAASGLVGGQNDALRPFAFAVL